MTRPVMALNLPPAKLVHLAKKSPAMGKVTIGNRQQPICIPRHSAMTSPGCTNKLPPRTTCLVEQAEHHNLPLGVVVNWCVAIPKARAKPIIIINTNKFNVWVRLPLLAVELYDTECNQIEYRTTMDWEGENIKIWFQPYLLS